MEPKVFKHGNKTEYVLNGQLHRGDGPAVIWINGDKEWYLNGLCHRLDGPAIECANGTKYWYVAGRRHRCDGPAYEHYTGAYYWFINGVNLTNEIGQWIRDTGFNQDYTNWTKEELLQFKLVWC